MCEDFFFNPCVLTPSWLKDKSPISFPESQSSCRAVGPTIHSCGGGIQWVPSLLASSYILPFTGISLISERGQGCMILRHNLATDTLGLCSPLPAHKFHFLKGTVKRGEAEMSPAGTTGPSTQVLPFTIHSLVLLLLLFSVPIPHAPSSLPPLAAGNGDTLCGHHMVQSSPHMSFCPGDTHWAVFIQKKQTSFLVAL